jgi:uncharacterized membrane protein YczE
MSRVKRYARVLFAQVLYGVGVYFIMQGNVGLSPWDTFQVGLCNMTGMMYGTSVCLVGFVVLLADVLMGEKIGIGSCLNVLLAGKFMDLFMWIGFIPEAPNFAVGVLMLLVGQVILSLAAFYAISPGLGCGPREALMVGIGKRLKKLPIGLVRGIIETTVLFLGWIMGCPPGVGTIISLFGSSLFLQITFHVLRFNARAIHHESLAETLHLKKKNPKSECE